MISLKVVVAIKWFKGTSSSKGALLRHIAAIFHGDLC